MGSTLSYLTGTTTATHASRATETVTAAIETTNDVETPASSTMLAALSKRQRKRLVKSEERRTRKRQRRERQRDEREAVKLARRAERTAILADLPSEERDRLKQERIAMMRAGRAEERAHRDHIRAIIANARGVSVTVDANWPDAMVDRECRSLARQLSYAYSSVRKAAEAGLQPIVFSVVGVDDALRNALCAVASGWEKWPVVVTERALVDVYDDLKSIVYLTHDADDVLHVLREDEVYVVGGLVDHNRLKGATATRAARLGVRTARLNIDQVVDLRRGTRVLTVNHCIDILLQVANGSTWSDAYLSVLPQRKGVAVENAS